MATRNAEWRGEISNARDGTLVARVVGNSHELPVLADELLLLHTSCGPIRSNVPQELEGLPRLAAFVRCTSSRSIEHWS